MAEEHHPQQSSPGSKGYKYRAACVVSPATQAVSALRLEKKPVRSVADCNEVNAMGYFATVCCSKSVDVEEGAHQQAEVRHDPQERHLIPRRSENEPGARANHG